MKDDLSWAPIDDDAPVDFRVFTVTRRRAAHPRTGQVRTFSIIDAPDWVNVIALTATDDVVLVRQFRHGTADLTLEIPGGMVDPGEAPLAAAQRELAEETGYRASAWMALGVVEPNPAIQSNRCHTFLALDAAPVEAQTLDPGEIIRIESAPLASIAGLVEAGEIRHALVIAGFFHLLRRAGGWRRP
ncbi:MAG: NUDIX hydrolase [Myxococcales bacterium]|nr:NUDIX hydrolase [Myxococcales bacterium]